MQPKLVHTAIAGCILGVGLYVATDVAGEYTTYVILRDQATKLAEDSDRLKKQLGHPFSLGPWYNARIGELGMDACAHDPCPTDIKLPVCTSGFSAGRNIAQCSFQLQGQTQITDLTVRGIRKTGVLNTLMYNVMGPGEWKLIQCTAMFPSGGGLVRPESLIPEPDWEEVKAMSREKNLRAAEGSDGGRTATSSVCGPDGCEVTVGSLPNPGGRTTHSATALPAAAERQVSLDEQKKSDGGSSAQRSWGWFRRQ